MDSSFLSMEEWRKARSKCKVHTLQKHQMNSKRWQPPKADVLKINVDASFGRLDGTFSVGMVLRDHNSTFLASKNLSHVAPGSVFEAEVIGTHEPLS